MPLRYGPDNRLVARDSTPGCTGEHYWSDQAGRRLGSTTTLYTAPADSGLRTTLSYTAGGQLSYTVTPTDDAWVFTSLAEVRQVTDDWLESYTSERPHQSLGRVPPRTYLPSPLPRERLLSLCVFDGKAYRSATCAPATRSRHGLADHKFVEGECFGASYTRTWINANAP